MNQPNPYKLPTATTKTDARQIAVWIRCLRPEWDMTGIMTALAGRSTVDPGRLALAALAAAANPSNRTPAVIDLEGPHWHVGATNTESPADRHPSNADVRTLCVECYKPQRVHPWIGCPGYVAKPRPAENIHDLLAAALAEARRGAQARTDAEHATAAAKGNADA